MKRAYNFNAGPSALPLAALEKAREEFLDFRGTGMSVMELSHRSKDYESVHNQTISLLKELLSIPENYDVLFLQGGASLQFAMVPMNFLPTGKKAGYVMTGSWSEKAYAEAKKIGEVFEAASAKDDKYRHIPALNELKYNQEDAYLHITSNNTIFGTEWQEFPDTGSLPLIADMSSDILSKPFDVNKFGLIYAGAQKISARQELPWLSSGAICWKNPPPIYRLCLNIPPLPKITPFTILLLLLPFILWDWFWPKLKIQAACQPCIRKIRKKRLLFMTQSTKAAVSIKAMPRQTAVPS
ncbi:phosphoserine aminotransferase [Holotrichia oblita]|nr:phosphoserine aminotransferase [Holotrichia oblita]